MIRWWRRRQVRRAVLAAWRDLVAHNPDARHLGGPRSMEVWRALDEMDRAS